MATTIHVPKKTRRRNGKKARTPRLPVPLDELPEYRDAVEWTVGVRAEAERKIAREASEVPIGVLQRLDALMGRTVTKRQRDLVELWSGVGARGKNGYHSEYYAIRELMLDFSLLPGIADDVGAWWLFHSDGRGKEHGECVNFHVLIDGHYRAESETALLLLDALRAVMASLIPEMPTAPALLGMLEAATGTTYGGRAPSGRSLRGSRHSQRDGVAAGQDRESGPLPHRKAAHRRGCSYRAVLRRT